MTTSVETIVIRSADAVVHLEYDPATLLPLDRMEYCSEDEQWTRFVCVSDTHGNAFPIPDGDVLLHSGDLTDYGTLEEFTTIMEWLYELPHKTKIIIAGNHDLTLHRDWYEDCWERWHDNKEDYDKIMELLTGDRAKQAGIVYLQNETFTFSVAPGRRSWTVYGSPWSPYFYDWAFNYRRTEAEPLIASFSSTDILLTHAPPAGILDCTDGRDFAGCKAVSSHLASGRLRPRLHLFGHIHESHGAYVHNWENRDQKCKIPQAQNKFYGSEGDDLFYEVDGSDYNEVQQELQLQKELLEAKNADPSVQRSVFVNAANQPAGLGRWLEVGDDDIEVPPGGQNFRPVIVDLKE
ncbi:Metallo-dependent phosphatase [Coprinopsis marcescibilis]|uniref:Metallo-dependent phosphatase n=1 Tax=Coprinopsis marcescibilis TaxID=230819 RepID=A0A5C3KFQ8_COPMA|nr:Metallo-dependent phosphatase [Coprinopsis marcescibilis]